MIPHLAIFGGAATITVAIFMGAYMLGRLYARVEKLENDYSEHLVKLHK